MQLLQARADPQVQLVLNAHRGKLDVRQAVAIIQPNLTQALARRLQALQPLAPHEAERAQGGAAQLAARQALALVQAERAQGGARAHVAQRGEDVVRQPVAVADLHPEQRGALQGHGAQLEQVPQRERGERGGVHLHRPQQAAGLHRDVCEHGAVQSERAQAAAAVAGEAAQAGQRDARLRDGALVQAQVLQSHAEVERQHGGAFHSVAPGEVQRGQRREVHALHPQVGAVGQVRRAQQGALRRRLAQRSVRQVRALSEVEGGEVGGGGESVAQHVVRQLGG
mmetsp:Transcript_45043/g.86123  ORF Transcript_45043/g.86123 Transcript_45043/m.86123 type:complete len:282 (+) Transcript_45043:1235-2080(+)